MDHSGERNARAKLSEDDVRTIRGLAGTVTNKELGRRFGVSDVTISYIILRRTWRHI